MNTYKLLILVLLLSFGNLIQANSQTIQTGPPEPPVGKRWVLNPDFSDEFNDTTLDSTKWLDHHPKWKGREPGIFLPSQVSVKDGYLQIKGEKLAKDTIVKAYGRELTFNIAGGAVVSKKNTLLGYYECRVKAAATTMSTTFWFSTDGSKKGPNGCDNYGLEWDIHESIGRNGDFDGSYFANGMHSNSHYWYTDCDGKKHDYRSAQVTFNNPEVSSKDFNVYGGWWRDKETASYYYNNSEPKHQKFYDKVMEQPFDRPMYMRLVCETYPFPWIKLPNDEELADPTKNVVYYDWVRGYKLVDVNDPNTNSKKGKIIEIFNESIMFKSAVLDVASAKTLKIPLTYKALEDREIFLKLTNSKGEMIAKTTISAYAGYANMLYNFELEKQPKTESGYVLTAIMRPINGNKKDKIDTSTLIINLVN